MGIGMQHGAWYAIAMMVITCAASALPASANPRQQHRMKIAKLADALLNVQGSVAFELPSDMPPAPVELPSVPVGQELYTLDLATHSVRATDYRVMVQLADGSLVEAPAGTVRTVRGEVAGNSGSLVAGSIGNGGLTAMVRFADGSRYWIEPVGSLIPEAEPGDHVIYQQNDVTALDLSCGTNDLSLRAPGPSGKTAEEIPIPHGHSSIQLGESNNVAINEKNPQLPQLPACGTGICIAELACDTDVEYFNTYGSVSGVGDRINAIVNVINTQYERDVDLTHRITQIIVRTAEPDPYDTKNSQMLVNQFRDLWLASHADVPRDLAQLFVGRQINNEIVGEAWTIGAACTSGAYSYVRSDYNGNFACATDLSAHELGHTWGAAHCNCPAHTMNATIVCANQFHPTETVPDIKVHRDSRTCLSNGGPEPVNNACTSALPVGEQTLLFSNINGTTDGPNEPAMCSFFNYAQIGSDIWYCYTAACDGTATVSLCNSDYDTKMAVYQGCGCPGTQPIACNDDFCGTQQRQSQVSFAADSGNDYMIRIGGFNGATGTGNLTITCTTGKPVCGNLVLEPTEQCDPPDGVTCSEDCEFLGLGHNCCALGHGTGCSDPDITDCVCSRDAFCCDTLWDLQCIDEVESFDCGTCGEQENDDCADATPIQEGAYVFDTREAATDGPNEPSVCNFFNNIQVTNDIWYCYTASCTGPATISLCGSGYDTKLAVYDGCTCPETASAVACNDDFCGAQGRQSEVSLDVTEYQSYLIRVGGYNGASGLGVLTVSCPECSADSECDDGLFCTGQERCIDQVCQAGQDPCGAGKWCHESTDACIPYGNGDFDADNDVDLYDFRYFQKCFGHIADPLCQPANINGDGMVDLDDYAAFAVSQASPTRGSSN